MHTFIERYRNALTLIGFAAATGAGLALGWGLHPGKELMHEPPAPAIELSNATVLERQPSLAVPSAILEAAAEVRGAKLERAAKLTVQPTQLDCEPLHVELGVLRMKDDTQRIVVRSDDAAILGGVDIPIDRTLPRAPKWSAGALYNPVDQTYGAYLDRDLGPFRAGIDLMQDRDHDGAMIVLRFGVRF